MDFGFETKIKPVKLEPVRIPRLHITKAGDRTLTSAQKRKLKEAVGFKCQRCKKKYPERLLEIHHKKAIHKHKSPYGIDVPVFSTGKKYIPKYDRHKSNLEVVCIYCHDKTKKQKRKPKPIWQQY